MTRRKFNFEDFFTVEVRKIEQDLSYDYSVDGVAGTVMECLEDKLSPGLYDTLYDLLLGFNNSAQLEMADNLLDFVCSNVMHSTGIYTADYVLAQLYLCIATGKGIVKREVVEHWLETNNY